MLVYIVKRVLMTLLVLFLVSLLTGAVRRPPVA